MEFEVSRVNFKLVSFQGKCKVKGDVAECSCDSGFAGSQCEVDLCIGLCRNGGASLDPARLHMYI